MQTAVESCWAFTGTPTGEAAAAIRGDRPFIPYSARVDMALRTYKHSVWRAIVRRDFSEPWCTSIPAYTGGEDIAQRPVAVDGAMRTPACFGGRGEPWAQGDGLGQDCGDTSDPAVRVVDIGLDRSAMLDLKMAFAAQ